MNKSFKTIVDELLLESNPLEEKVPASGDWTIFDDNGMVIKSRFWEDLVEPGTKLYITPRKRAALDPRRGELISGPVNAPDASALSKEASLNLPRACDLIDLNDDGPSIDGSETGNGSVLASSGLSSSGMSSSVSPISADYEFDGQENWRMPRKSQKQAHSDKPAVKPAPHIKYTQRDSNYKIVRIGNVQRTCPVADFIAGLLKGRPGSKIQVLRQSEGPRGFLPGQTFMAGTQKTFEQLNLGDHFQFTFTQAPRMRHNPAVSVAARVGGREFRR
jgi:hypothetical protein